MSDANETLGNTRPQRNISAEVAQSKRLTQKPQLRKTDTQRLKLLMKNYINAKKQGLIENYDIKPIVEDNYEEYYILINPRDEIYRDQFHILTMKTKYGTGADETTYPNNAPYIRFGTVIYHTNISPSEKPGDGGAICLDILKESDKWMPTYDFNSIIFNILLLLNQPNNASPFNSDASRAYMDCEARFKTTYTEYKKTHRGTNISLQEMEKLRASIFQPYKLVADEKARQNNLALYVEWFPQLKTVLDARANKPGIVLPKNPAACADLEELAELENMLSNLQKKPANSMQPTQPTQPTQINPTQTNESQQTPTPPAEQRDETQPTQDAQPTQTAKKPSKWLKLIKK